MAETDEEKAAAAAKAEARNELKGLIDESVKENLTSWWDSVKPAANRTDPGGTKPKSNIFNTLFGNYGG
jgi:hypothetical protein